MNVEGANKTKSITQRNCQKSEIKTECSPTIFHATWCMKSCLIPTFAECRTALANFFKFQTMAKFRIVEQKGKFYIQQKAERLFSTWKPYSCYGVYDGHGWDTYDGAMTALLNSIKQRCISESRGYVDSVKMCDVRIGTYTELRP